MTTKLQLQVSNLESLMQIRGNDMCTISKAYSDLEAELRTVKAQNLRQKEIIDMIRKITHL